MKIPIKKILAIISVIILGAIGSGVWDYLLKPFLKIFPEVILTIITFGIKGLQDNIYLEVAKGFHEIGSILIFTSLIAALTGFLFFGVLAYIQISQKLSNEDKNTSNQGCPDEGIVGKIRKRYRFILILVIIFLVVWLNWTWFRVAYINDKVTYYNQLYDTVAPFINEKEQLMIKSNFSQIKNKEDYDVIIDHLKKIANENNQTYREYTLLY